MATTYLTLSNRVLRELNEVEMTSSNFSSSRGIQTAIKDFIKQGYRTKDISTNSEFVRTSEVASIIIGIMKNG